MPAIAPESLPPRAYRRNVKPPALLPGKAPRKVTAKLSNKLARRALFMEIAPSIALAGRTFHVETARTEVIKAQGEGYLQDEVAVIVDNSASRRVANVRFGGSIVYVDNPSSQAAVAEATAFVFDYAFQSARLYRKSGRHMSGFQVLVDDHPTTPNKILGFADKHNWQRMTVTNVIPYSAKLEDEYKQNGHILWGAFKKARQAGWTKRVSMKFVIEAQGYQAVDGGRIRRPTVHIEKLGAFVSKGPRRGDWK